MMELTQEITARERELGAIIGAYNQVTERLKVSHEQLGEQVGRLRRELEEKNQELARHERLGLLGEMAAGVAHEIRNPLSSILLYATMLQRAASAEGDCQALAGKVVTGVRTLEGIVGDILAFAGSDVDGSAHFSTTDLSAIVRDVVELSSSRATAKSATVVAEVPEGPVNVVGNAAQLRRAILNLAHNAVDAVDDGGRVRVALRANVIDGIVECTVTDNGPGVPEAWIKRIYDPFFTTKAGGTGLGLAIVHRVVQAHGGTIRVDNLSTGGARFTLTLRAEDKVKPRSSSSCSEERASVRGETEPKSKPIGLLGIKRRTVDGVPLCH